MTLAKKIDHVAIAVKDLDAAVKTFTENFGFPVDLLGELPGLGIRSAMLTIGDARLELIVPTGADNPVQEFLGVRGEGMYLLALEVDSLEQAIKELVAKGIKVGPTLSGPDKSRFAFVSPRATHGVLLQVIQHRKAEGSTR